MQPPSNGLCLARRVTWDFPLAAFAAAECVGGTRALFGRSRYISFLISGPFSSGEIGEFLALAVAIDKLCENEVELSNE